MAILLRDKNVVYRPGSKIPIRQSREKVLSASRNSHLSKLQLCEAAAEVDAAGDVGVLE